MQSSRVSDLVLILFFTTISWFIIDSNLLFILDITTVLCCWLSLSLISKNDLRQLVLQ